MRDKLKARIKKGYEWVMLAIIVGILIWSFINSLFLKTMPWR